MHTLFPQTFREMVDQARGDYPAPGRIESPDQVADALESADYLVGKLFDAVELARAGRTVDADKTAVAALVSLAAHAQDVAEALGFVAREEDVVDDEDDDLDIDEDDLDDLARQPLAFACEPVPAAAAVMRIEFPVAFVGPCGAVLPSRVSVTIGHDLPTA